MTIHSDNPHISVSRTNLLQDLIQGIESEPYQGVFFPTILETREDSVASRVNRTASRTFTSCMTDRASAPLAVGATLAQVSSYRKSPNDSGMTISSDPESDSDHGSDRSLHIVTSPASLQDASLPQPMQTEEFEPVQTTARILIELSQSSTHGIPKWDPSKSSTTDTTQMQSLPHPRKRGPHRLPKEFKVALQKFVRRAKTQGKTVLVACQEFKQKTESDRKVKDLQNCWYRFQRRHQK